MNTTSLILVLVQVNRKHCNSYLHLIFIVFVQIQSEWFQSWRKASLLTANWYWYVQGNKINFSYMQVICMTWSHVWLIDGHYSSQTDVYVISFPQVLSHALFRVTEKEQIERRAQHVARIDIADWTMEGRSMSNLNKNVRCDQFIELSAPSLIKPSYSLVLIKAIKNWFQSYW